MRRARLPVDRQIIELAIGFAYQSLKGGRVVALNHGWHDTPASEGPRPAANAASSTLIEA